jgi:DNA-binding XRE family transcriptional regulator
MRVKTKPTAVTVPPVEDAEVEGMLKVLCRVLVRERRRQRLAQQEVARRAGLSRPALSFMEAGAHDPALGSYIRVGEALGGFGSLMDRAQEVWRRYSTRVQTRN